MSMTENFGFYLSDVGRLMRKRFDAMSKTASGITGTQWRVILNVHRTPGISQGQLAERLEVEPITTCRMVDRLEQAGLLERRRHPSDRRVWRIYLTDAAVPLINELRTIGEDILRQATEGFTEEESALLLTMLERLRGNMLNDTPSHTKEARNG